MFAAGLIAVFAAGLYFFWIAESEEGQAVFALVFLVISLLLLLVGRNFSQSTDFAYAIAQMAWGGMMGATIVPFVFVFIFYGLWRDERKPQKRMQRWVAA